MACEASSGNLWVPVLSFLPESGSLLLGWVKWDLQRCAERLPRLAPRQKFYFLGLNAPHERPDEMVTRTDWPPYPIL